MTDNRISESRPSFPIRIAEFAALLLTVLLPVKFASIVSVPEMPASYWFDPVSIAFTSWPINLFLLFSSILLIFTALALPKGRVLRNRGSALFAALWGLLACLSFLGWINASCRMYALQMSAYACGTGAFFLSVYLLLDNNPAFGKALFRALLLGGALSAASGLYQYLYGFQALQQHVYEQNLRTGAPPVAGQFLSRIQEARLQADFSICNTYGGYLAFLLPLVFGALWVFGNTRVQPEKTARWILSVPAALFLLFLIVLTGSRGALFAMVTAFGVLCLALPVGRKTRWTMFGILIFCAAGFLAVVVTGRGFSSMIFRFDYDYASLRMMLAHPFAGTGWGDFFHDYQILKLLMNDEAPHTPHNMAFLFGAQCGIAAFFCALALLILPFVQLFRAALRAGDKTWNDRIPIYAALAAVSAALADFMLEICYETPAFLCSFGILAFLSMSRPELPSKPGPGTVFFRIPCLILGVGTAVFAVFQIRSESLFAEFHETLDPRFSREALMEDGAFHAASPDRVRSLLKEASAADSTNPFLWSMAADYMAAYGNLFAAKDYVTQAIARSPQRAAFYLHRARIVWRMTLDPAQVAPDLEKVRSLFPRNDRYMVPDSELLEPPRPEE